MKKSTQTIEPTSEVAKKEFNLKEAFALWKTTSKKGLEYLSGLDLNKCKLVAYFNTNKKNPKEPDIRVYTLNAEGKQDKEVASLWAEVSKNEKKYLTGTTDEKEKLVAFYGEENQEKRPFIRAYFSEE